MSDKIQDKFAVLLAGFRTSEGAPRLVIPEAGADAAAMLKSKAGAAVPEGAAAGVSFGLSLGGVEMEGCWLARA